MSFLWCMYCQQLQREVPPFDQYEMSHGICPKCLVHGLEPPEELLARTEVLKKLQEKLWTAGRHGDLKTAERLVDAAQSRGMRSVDFMAGIVAPLLYRVGDLWASGELAVEDEHRFTSFCVTVFKLVSDRMGSPSAPPSSNATSSDLLIVNAQGNCHFIGIRLIELWCRCEGVQALALSTPPSPPELRESVLKYLPRALAVSMSMPGQLPAVLAVRDSLMDWIQAGKLRVFVGGHAVKEGLVERIPGVELCSDAAAMIRLL